VGMLTDRDLVVRGMAQGLPPDDTPLREVMSREVQWCYEGQPVDEVGRVMSEAQIRRLPVVDREQRLVGMVSLGDLAVKGDTDAAAQALQGVSRPA